MPIRLILVDDHRVMRDGLRLRLGQEPDFLVVGDASNTTEAGLLLAQTPADVVLLDLNLPGESGLMLVGRLRERWPKLGILILTGDTDPTAANDAILAGANGYVRKEEASDELVRAIRAVAEGKNYLSADGATAITRALRARASGATEGELSERELAVLKGLAEGQSYKEIAGELNVSVKSIETYRARLVKKTGCSTRADLVRFAIRRGLVKA